MSIPGGEKCDEKNNEAQSQVSVIYSDNQHNKRCDNQVTHTLYPGYKTGFELWFHGQYLQNSI